jgi:outer membrane lipoprotein LolB
MRRRSCAAALAAAGLLAGCAWFRPKTKASFWQGRIAIKDPGEPQNNISASFELQGNASSGSLSLFNMLGLTLASMRWSEGFAELQSGGETQTYTSADAMLSATLGHTIPLDAVFGWLTGSDAAVPGWDVDRSRYAERRLRARKTALAPPKSGGVPEGLELLLVWDAP